MIDSQRITIIKSMVDDQEQSPTSTYLHQRLRIFNDQIDHEINIDPDSVTSQNLHIEG